ncbi:MAG: DNA-formamidopyrimidine glycosylase family protein, partial [Acidimicrobiales bacterium]
MPELPEVETVRRELEPWLVERSIISASHHHSAKFSSARDAVGTTI